MSRPPLRPAQLCGRCFRGSCAVRAGLLTRRQLQSSAWRRLFHDVYADAALPDSYLLRCGAAALILPPGCALTGRSAACLRGLPLGELGDRVQVITRGRFRAKGFDVRQAALPLTQVLPGDPPVTIPERTAWEIASEPDLDEAVVALDVLLAHGYVTGEHLAAWAIMRPRSRAGTAIRLADGRSDSPQETRTRLRLRRAGFPPPVPQYVLRCDGRFVAKLDFAWPGMRVGVEYDGLHHAGGRFLRVDRARMNRLLDAGWLVLTLTASDLADSESFDRFCAQLRRAIDNRSPRIAHV